MDARTMAFINLHAVLGSIPALCRLVPEAKALIEGKKVSIGFEVKNGPSATLFFENGECRLENGTKGCKVKLPFSSCEKFNGMIDGTVTPIPSKGFLHIGFLLGPFMKLTDILSKYLRPAKEDLENEDFFMKSTKLMFHLIVCAVAQIGNEDEAGRVSASYVTDGKVKLAIAGGPSAYILCKDHRLTPVHEDTDDWSSKMEFANIRLARALFDGEVNSFACIGTGDITVCGMISQLDNVNRMLDRVALYLA